MEQWKHFIADLARPFAIYAASVSGFWATVVVASKVSTAEGGALVLSAVGLTWTALYAGKAIEETRKSLHRAEVEKAQVAASPPPGAVAITATPDVDVTIREADDGELPADQRVKL